MERIHVIEEKHDFVIEYIYNYNFHLMETILII